MSARDDHQVLASVEDVLPARGLNYLARAIGAVLDEIDDLRSRTGAVNRIEALRARARAAEADADRLYRALRDVKGRDLSDSVFQLHLDALKERAA